MRSDKQKKHAAFVDLKDTDHQQTELRHRAR